MNNTMTLYIPKLAANASPPLHFPPKWRNANVLFCAALMAVTYAILKLIRASIMPSAPLLGRTVSVFLMYTVGYYYISKCILQRERWHDSRYGDYKEFLKLMATGPVFTLLGGLTWLEDPNIPLIFVLPIFGIMLHFIYGDNIAFLQVWGCKWADPGRWKSCNSREVLFTAIVFSIVFGLIGWNVHVITVQKAWVSTTSMIILPVLAFLAAYASVRRTHTLHLHHYAVVLLLAPFTAFATTGSAVTQMMMLAVFIDGIACWGMDPLFVRIDTPISSSDIPTMMWVNLISELDNQEFMARHLAKLSELEAVLSHLVAQVNPNDLTAVGMISKMQKDFFPLLRQVNLQPVSAQLRTDSAALPNFGFLLDVAPAHIAFYSAVTTWLLCYFAGAPEIHRVTQAKLQANPSAILRAFGHHPLCGILTNFKDMDKFWDVHRAVRTHRDGWDQQLKDSAESTRILDDVNSLCYEVFMRR